MKKIPMPQTINWLERYGSWEGLCKAVEKSVGRKLARGKLTFYDPPQQTRHASR